MKPNKECGFLKKGILAACLGLMIFPSQSQSAALAKTYDLTETDSQIIKFDKSLKRALIANPDLATVKVLSKMSC